MLSACLLPSLSITLFFCLVVTPPLLLPYSQALLLSLFTSVATFPPVSLSCCSLMYILKPVCNPKHLGAVGCFGDPQDQLGVHCLDQEHFDVSTVRPLWLMDDALYPLSHSQCAYTLHTYILCPSADACLFTSFNFILTGVVWKKT